MTFFVQITDNTGRVLSRVEGADRSELDALSAKAMHEVTNNIIGRLKKSLPDDIRPPLTVTWGDVDA